MLYANQNTSTSASTPAPVVAPARSHGWYLAYLTATRVLLFATTLILPLYLWPLVQTLVAQDFGQFVLTVVVAVLTAWSRVDLGKEIRKYSDFAVAHLGYVPELWGRRAVDSVV